VAVAVAAAAAAVAVAVAVVAAAAGVVGAGEEGSAKQAVDCHRRRHHHTR